MAGTLLLLAALFTGSLQKAGEWAGQQFVGVIAPDESLNPAPAPKQKQKKDPARKKDRAVEDAASGQN